MRIGDWSSDVCSSDLYPRRMALANRVRQEMEAAGTLPQNPADAEREIDAEVRTRVRASGKTNVSRAVSDLVRAGILHRHYQGYRVDHHNRGGQRQAVYTLSPTARKLLRAGEVRRSEEHTSELQSLMRISYAVFCLKK